MRYKYYVTRETKAKMEKWNLGHDADAKLNNLLMSASQLDSTAISANVLVDKFNNHSGLRFIWQSEIQQDVCIYPELFIATKKEADFLVQSKKKC